jgi:Chaperone of endosialidase
MLTRIKFIFFISFIFISVNIFAANPAQPFLPSDNILDPNCTPLDSNCYVLLTSFTNETVTGLDYSTSTGILSLTSGYVIPTVASTTEWASYSAGASGADSNLGSFFVNSGYSLNAEDNIITGLSIGSSTLPSLSFFGDEDTGIYSPSVNTLSLSTAGVERLTVSSSGNVGIGTTTPTEKLSIAGDINLTGALKVNGNAGTSGFVLQSTGSGLNWVAGVSTSTLIAQGGNSFGTTTTIGSNDNNALIFETNNTRTGYISANGLAVAFGLGAGSGGASQSNTFFVGNGAASGATGASNSNFIGNASGQGATGASGSNFIGNGSGWSATNASASNFLGSSAGERATNANNSNFLGNYAGESATSANNSNFLGNYSGNYATNANNSNFLGNRSGSGATNASYSNFLGSYAGNGAANAANSIFMGINSGLNDTVNNTTGNKYSILLGNYASTGGFSNSIAIGQGVQNSATDQLNIARVIYATSIGSSTTPTATPYLSSFVGIGTSTPAYRLSVAGDLNFTGALRSNGDAGTAGYVLLSNGTSAPTWVATSTLGISGGGGSSQWTTAGSDIYYSTGNVGIGTASPVTLLDISASNPIMRIRGPSDFSTNTFYFSHGGNAGTSIQQKIAIISRGTGAYGKGNLYFALNDSNDNTNASITDSKLTILGDGNIGIGKTSPLNKLDVNGGANIGTVISGSGSGSVNTAILNVFSPTAATSLTNTTENAFRIVRNGTAASKYNPSVDFNIGSHTAGLAASTQLDIRLGNGNSNLTDMIAMSILGNGNIGIGTTNPQASLHIVRGTAGSFTPVGDEVFVGQRNQSVSDNSVFTLLSGTSGNSQFRFGDGDSSFAGRINYNNSTNQFDFGTNGTADRMVITSTGNIGIGTTTPTEKLSVAGNINLTGALKINGDAGTSGYVLQSTGTGINWVAGVSTSTLIAQGGNSFGTTTTIGSNDNNALIFETNNTRTGYISANGLAVAFGLGAGSGGASQSNTFFVGSEAGFGATGSSNSNFLGNQAGYNATSAYNSNFFGSNAGNVATGAYESNFLGASAGQGATSARHSNFLGVNSGRNATDANTSNFLGPNAGYNASSAFSSNFLGSSAGYGATSAYYSNFLGANAGNGATGANTSNFLGPNAGNSAISAYGSNFFGSSAGQNATNAPGSNFLGNSAGQNATNAQNSNFLGTNAGFAATSADNSNFLGANAGNGATGASASNFFGVFAGLGATSATNSNFFGYAAGVNMTSGSHSNFFGTFAGNGATSASHSNFLGNQAGISATAANNSNFLGSNAGNSASAANNSNFFGNFAGINATSANNSNFFGYTAGQNASAANNSNFFGQNAGQNAASSSNSNFFGYYAGESAVSSFNSNFIGYIAGKDATNASNSNFIGNNTGRAATNAANSIFMGIQSGLSDTVNNTTGNKYSILLGNYTKTGGFSNSIAIGQGVQNSAADQLNIARIIYATSIGSSTSPTATPFAPAFVGIGTSTPADKLQVFGDIRVGTAGSNGCIKDYAGTGITGTCSSDERLKTNVVDLSDGYLEKLVNLKVITYNWNEEANTLNKVDTTVTNYGLLAQNVESIFPELVTTDSNGYKQVNYSRLPLYLLKSVQELSKKVAGLFDGSAKIKVKELCLEDVCVTKDQLQQLLQQQNITPSVYVPPTAPEQQPVSTTTNTVEPDIIPIVTDETVPTEESPIQPEPVVEIPQEVVAPTVSDEV